MQKLKIRFLANLRFDEFYVTRRLSEVCPDINIRDIHNTNSFAIIVLDSEVECNKLLQQDILSQLERFHLKPVPSQAYSSSKALFVTKLRPHVLKSSQDAILQDLNMHNEHQARAVFVLQNKRLGIPSTLKILYNDPSAVDYVSKHGLRIFDLAISPENIHKEEHIEINQCFRCFSFCHKTKTCSSPVQKCSICAEHHHYKVCNSNRTKCALCDGPHQATFVRCPIRLLHINNLNENTARSADIPVPIPSTSGVNFPPLPSSHAQPPSHPYATSHPTPIPESSVRYSSVLKTPPPIPHPPKSLYNNPPLASKFTKLAPRSSSSSALQRRNPQRPVPPPSSTTHPRALSPSAPTHAPLLSPPAGFGPSHPDADPVLPPPPASAYIPPPPASAYIPPPPPPSTSTSYPPEGSALITHGQHYIQFKIADRLADKLAGSDHYLYARIMNNFLSQCNLPLLNIEEFFHIANVPIPDLSNPTPIPPPPEPTPSPAIRIVPPPPKLNVSLPPSSPPPFKPKSTRSRNTPHPPSPSKPASPPPKPSCPRSPLPPSPSKPAPPPPNPSCPRSPAKPTPSPPSPPCPQTPVSSRISPPTHKPILSLPTPSKPSSVQVTPPSPASNPTPESPQRSIPTPPAPTKTPSLPPTSQPSSVISSSPRIPPPSPLPAFLSSPTSLPTKPSVTTASPSLTPPPPLRSSLSSPTFDFTPTFLRTNQSSSTPSLPLPPRDPSSLANASLPQRPPRSSRARQETVVDLNPSSQSIPPTLDLVSPSPSAPSQESDIFVPHNLPLHSPSQSESPDSLNLRLTESLPIQPSLNLHLSSSTPSASQSSQVPHLTPIQESYASFNSTDSNISVDVEGSPTPPSSANSADIFITQQNPPMNRYPLRNKVGSSSCSSSRSTSPLTM